MHVSYKFNNFHFINDCLMTHDMQDIPLPPKERSVLLLMLERPNEVLSKEVIIESVWKSENVSDESLTRCIYILRRALCHSNDNQIIATIYGKGYKFTQAVNIVEEPEDIDEQNTHRDTAQSPHNSIKSDGKCHIALFPFALTAPALSSYLHDKLVEWFYSYIPLSEFNLVSYFFTRTCQNYEDILLTIEKTQTDYYIYGAEVTYNDESIVRIELIRATDHCVLHRGCVQLTKNHHADYNKLCSAISLLISEINTDLDSELISHRLPSLVSSQRAIRL